VNDLISSGFDKVIGKRADQVLLFPLLEKFERNGDQYTLYKLYLNNLGNFNVSIEQGQMHGFEESADGDVDYIRSKVDVAEYFNAKFVPAIKNGIKMTRCGFSDDFKKFLKEQEQGHETVN
jgi:hypothetical protein